jgi:hypothetical protein
MMILSRRVTRSFDEYYEVEITDELVKRLEDLQKAYDKHDLLDLTDLTNKDLDELWGYLEDLHGETGDVIVLEDDGFWSGTDDTCEYQVLSSSEIDKGAYA